MPLDFEVGDGGAALPSGTEGDFLVYDGGAWGGSQDDPRLSFDPAATTPGGRLYVPPAYMQTSGDAAVALTSANHKIAVGFTPDVDFELSALSVYVTAISVTGDCSVSLCADGTANEPNGYFQRASDVNALATLSANGSDCSATSENASYPAWKAFNKTYTSVDCWQSTATPTVGSPQALLRDLGAGNETIFNRARIYTAHSTDANFRCFPRDFTIEADQGDDNWTVLKTVTSETEPGWPNLSTTVDQYRELGFVNNTAYRRYRLNITARNGSGGFVSVGEFALFPPLVRSAPGSQISGGNLGSFAIGSSVDTWVRHTFTAVQLYGGRKYWLVFSGAAAKNFSLSARRVNSANGSMFPYSCETRHTTDGTSWTETQQNDYPAMMNVVLQSTTHHAPQLVYGRCTGRQVATYSGTAWVLRNIPAAGLVLDCEALSAPNAIFGYNVSVYDNAGTLAITADTSATTYQDGVAVSVANDTRRTVGQIYPLERLVGYWAPICCPDEVLVWNLYNRRRVTIGKSCPYVGVTNLYNPSRWWRRIGDGDYRLRILLGSIQTVTMFVGPVLPEDTCYVALGVAIDDVLTEESVSIGNAASPGSTFVSAVGNLAIQPGIHELHPTYTQNAIVYVDPYYPIAGSRTRSDHIRTQFVGTAEV